MVKQISQINFLKIVDHVRSKIDLYKPLNNESFCEAVKKHTGLDIGSSTVRTVRKVVGLPPLRRAPSESLKRTPSQGLRLVSTECRRLFLLLGIDESELERLRSFASGQKCE